MFIAFSLSCHSLLFTHLVSVRLSYSSIIASAIYETFMMCERARCKFIKCEEMLAREKILQNKSRVVQLFNALYVAIQQCVTVPYSMLLHISLYHKPESFFFTFRCMSFFHIFDGMNFRNRSNFRLIYASNGILIFHFVLKTCST